MCLGNTGQLIQQETVHREKVLHRARSLKLRCDHLLSQLRRRLSKANLFHSCSKQYWSNFERSLLGYPIVASRVANTRMAAFVDIYKIDVFLHRSKRQNYSFFVAMSKRSVNFPDSFASLPENSIYNHLLVSFFAKTCFTELRNLPNNCRKSV